MQDQIEAALEAVITWFVEALLDLINALVTGLVTPLVSTPFPAGSSGWIVVGTPTNAPWTGLYENVYLAIVLPLSLGLLFIALAYLGIRTGSMSQLLRQRLLRRMLVALGAIFFWFPAASIALRFFDAIGKTVAFGSGSDATRLIGDLNDALVLSTGAAVLLLLVALVESILIIAAVLIFALRWLSIILLTITMPLLAAFWVFEVWPLHRFAGIAGRAASLYPGLLVAGLPPAFLLRVAIEARFDFGFGGVFGVFVGAILLPGAAVASLLAISWSSRGFRRVALSTAGAGMATASGTPAAVRRAKVATGTGTRGVRNIHRGFRGSTGALRVDGTTEFGAGRSRAYATGSRLRQTHRRVGTAPARGLKAGSQKVSAYSMAHRDPDQRLRDVARRDLAGIRTRTVAVTRWTAARTKDKLSRW